MATSLTPLEYKYQMEIQSSRNHIAWSNGSIKAQKHVLPIISKRLNEFRTMSYDEQAQSIDKMHYDILSTLHFRLCQQRLPPRVVEERMKEYAVRLRHVKPEIIIQVLKIPHLQSSRL